jgi:hypothetical protein
MQYLTIKNRHKTDKKQAMVVRKTRKFGEVIDTKYIHTKKSVMIVGDHASGKSYWLSRLHKDASKIWSARPSIPVFLSASRPVSSWADGKHFETWWALRDMPDEDRHWTKLKAYERQDQLQNYLKETKSVLFIDDAHKMTGSKMKLAQSCLRASQIFVLTTVDEGRIAPSFRKDIMSSDAQIFRLNSDVAFDATSIMMWMFILIAAGFGAYEVAMVLGGLKALSGGRRASKQD